VSFSTSTNFRHGRLAQLLVAMAYLAAPPWSAAQSGLSLRDAIDQALRSRASLKAEAERVPAAEGRKRQAGLWPNAEFQFGNENLRPGQTYARDVDTLAYITQPLDILGKRPQRVETAQQTVELTKAEYGLARRDVIENVTRAYWTARGAQERQELLKATVANFQRIIDYHTAQLSVGAIAEQDVLRVRLEGERLAITASMAALDATRGRVQLLREMGRPDVPGVVLTDPLDAMPDARGPVAIGDVLAMRIEMLVARASVAEAQANERLQAVSARPDLSIVYGYKRTELPDAFNGVNTALAGVRLTIPLTDRNQGNRAAAAADLRRQGDLLAAAETDVRADVERARQEYELRRAEVVDTLQPLREHARSITEIAQAAYAQGGIDLLRLLDAERVRLEADLAWVQGMVEFQQSRANLDAAEGVTR
jgi:cobalt-zinc-cadmium efflux system outer membrane protein